MIPLLLISTIVSLTPANLKQCFEWALKRSESVAIQQQSIAEAEAKFAQAIGAVLPKITARGTETLQDDSANKTSGSTVADTFTRFSRPEVKIGARQPLFSGFREFYAMKGIRALRRAEDAGLEQAKRGLFLDVANAFYATVQLKEEHQAAIAIRTALEKRLSAMERRVALGQSRQSEQLSTETELALAKAAESASAGRMADAIEVLHFFTGENVDPIIDDTSLPATLPDLEEWLGQLSQHPNLQNAQAKKEAAHSNWSAEKGLRFPTLNAEANYYPYRVGFQEDIKWDALFSLDVPLFRGGEAHGKIRQARAQSRQADLAYEETKKKAEMEARQSYHNFVASRESMTALAVAQTKGEENYLVMEKEYHQGVTNNLEVLTALKQWQELKRQYWQAYAQAHVNWWQLKVAMGESVP